MHYYHFEGRSYVAGKIKFHINAKTIVLLYQGVIHSQIYKWET